MDKTKTWSEELKYLKETLLCAARTRRTRRNQSLLGEEPLGCEFKKLEESV